MFMGMFWGVSGGYLGGYLGVVLGDVWGLVGGMSVGGIVVRGPVALHSPQLLSIPAGDPTRLAHGWRVAFTWFLR